MVVGLAKRMGQGNGLSDTAGSGLFNSFQEGPILEPGEYEEKETSDTTWACWRGIGGTGTEGSMAGATGQHISRNTGLQIATEIRVGRGGAPLAHCIFNILEGCFQGR